MQKQIMYHPESDCYLLGGDASDYDNDCHEVDPTNVPAGRQIGRVGLHHATALPSFDFETYSEAGYTIDPVTGRVKGITAAGKGGLMVVGTPVYAEHPSTEVLCLYYNLKDGQGTRGWVPGMPAPTDLIEYIRSGGPIEAFNITFEFWIWNMICVRRFNWPLLDLDQCYCAMSKSRRNSLPGGLDGAARVLGTLGKDKDGKRLIQKLCRPRTPTKHRAAHRWTQATAWDDFIKIYNYCGQDVDSEDAVSDRTPDLTEYERKTWLVDQTINLRGVRVDVEALDAALVVMHDMINQYTSELCTLTGGAVGTASELAKLQAWLAEQGVYMPNMQADTVKEQLTCNTMTGPAHRALEIRSILAGANIKKLPTLKAQISSDGRLRDQYMYCGADRTGRWSAGGVQLQNITSKGPKSAECEACGHYFNPQPVDGHPSEKCPKCGSFMFHTLSDWTVEAVEGALIDIKTLKLDYLTYYWGDPSTLLAGCLRGMFIAAIGKRFICCDFSAIEAVIAACLSRCQWRIDVFSTHGKIYEQSAANATGVPFKEILQYKIDNGFDHPDRKKIGKVRELAGGYGGWINAWKNFGADKFMNDEEIKADVLKWRDESPEIPEMWGGQFRWCGPGKWDYRPELFGLEGMAIKAILDPGTCYSYIDITYGVYDDILYCRLPSGRYLCYHKPKLILVDDKLKRDYERQYHDGGYYDVRVHDNYQITFEGNSSATRTWSVQETYGGKLFENVVQAVAADIQAEALVRLEAANYPVVMHTHDEAIAEVEYGRGSVDEMAAIMSERPDWASWWPLKAAGWEHERYQKD